MTTDEKAKAYDEALERAKEFHHPQSTTIRGIIEEIFPQLRESEDERIRKALVWHLKAGEDFVSNGVTKAECIAYLEKQKYDRMKPIYDAKESFESALEKAWNDYHNGYENVDKLEDDYVECAHAKGFREGYLFGIEKQKEQKPNIEICPHSIKSKSYKENGYPIENCDYGLEIALAILEKTLGEVQGYQTDDGLREHQTAIKAVKDAMKEQKPVEWSEEDEKMIDTIVSALGQYIDYKAVSGTGSGYATPRYSKEIAWLKSLRPPKDCSNDCPKHLQGYIDGRGDAEKKLLDEYGILIMPEGELHMKARWKPSKEQMEALMLAIEGKCSPTSYMSRRLEDLYEQLKKL